jgi:hypothetical protein
MQTVSLDLSQKYGGSGLTYLILRSVSRKKHGKNV